jgi:emfourin
MAHGEGALNASIVAVGLVQSGGIAGQEMTATVRLADLPPADADHTRGLVEQVLAEQPPPASAPMYDALEYELTVSCEGAPDRQIHTRDGALTPAQRELIGVLRPHLHPR